MKKILGLIPMIYIVLLSTIGYGQDYPVKPIRLIVPWAAGGIVDVVARIVGKELSVNLAQPVIVDNQPGAGGTIGANSVVKSNPDGYTLLAISVALAYYPSCYPNLPFSPVKDLTPIGPLAEAPQLLIVNRSVPAKNVSELIDYAKANPGKLTYASSGVGTPAHLAAELFNKMAGISVLHVPYNGAAPALMDVLGGRVSMFFCPITAALPQLKSERIRVIATCGLERSPLLPEVPTVSESGVPHFEAGQWIAVFAPVRTPKPIIEKLHVEISRIGKTKAIKDSYGLKGVEPLIANREEFAALFQKDINKWEKVIKAAGIVLQ
ncbi:MAG: tripartite tricarboxylate transporter substrate binding protein [Deltaproteobacteria bacterium]|nr:tripartite tricarboxylate transporter substrate binding protein [Deltaproteobacteria bacterium]